jgi:hypothetical protein
MSKATLVLFAILVAYFLPAVIAHTRRHRQRILITLLNSLLGWTGIGWVLVFVWSWSPNVELI